MTTDFKKILHNFLIHQHQAHAWKIELLEKWENILGNLRTKVILEKIYEDTLVLSVHDSCWLQELYLLSPLLITTINANLDQPRIKNLRFKLSAPRIKKTKKNTKEEDETHNSFNTRALNAKEQEALNAVRDDGLRKILHDFLMQCSQERV